VDYSSSEKALACRSCFWKFPYASRVLLVVLFCTGVIVIYGEATVVIVLYPIVTAECAE